MVNGRYTNKPFEFNIKCVIFASAMIMVYWIASKSKKTNYWLFPVIFFASYIAMAWYDYMYNCSSKLKSGTSTLAGMDSIFKPKTFEGSAVGSNAPGTVGNAIDQEAEYKKNVYAFHFFIAMPLFIYVSYVLYAEGDEKYEEPALIALVLSGAGLLYHGYRLLNLLPKD